MTNTAPRTASSEPAAPLELSTGKMKILKAVTSLLEEPNKKITINRIANHISVTEAALYRHYRSKEDIFQDLFDYTQSHFMVPLDTAQRDLNTALPKRLFNVFEAYTDFLGLHPGLARLLLGHANTETSGLSEKVALLHAKIRSQLSLMMKRAVADQQLVLNHTPDELADMFYSVAMSAALATSFDLPQLPWQQRWDVFKTAFLGADVSKAALSAADLN